MADRARLLARIDRVRAVQLTLARGAEAQAQAHAASETALGHRIAQLAEGVAPASMAGAGFSLAAVAHYRDRLQQSAHAAQARVRVAQDRAADAAEASRAAERDAKAVEKLRARADADVVRAEMRALENAPVTARAHGGGANRHDPC